jgi:hypothetical protein
MRDFKRCHRSASTKCWGHRPTATARFRHIERTHKHTCAGTRVCHPLLRPQIRPFRDKVPENTDQVSVVYKSAPNVELSSPTAWSWRHAFSWVDPTCQPHRLSLVDRLTEHRGLCQKIMADVMRRMNGLVVRFVAGLGFAAS